VPKLTITEVDAFLDEPGHLVRVATVDEDGMPRNVPIWFIRHDEQIVFTPRARSVFLANLLRDPRVGLTIDEEPLPYRKVTVQGRADLLHAPGEDDDWRDLYREIAYRYVDREQADAYVDNTVDQPRALLGVPLSGADVRVLTWRMPVNDEDPTGIWHRRYYLDGTVMAKLADGTP
jgi:PPOX class probable F420-dependent enzyme